MHAHKRPKLRRRAVSVVLASMLSLLAACQGESKQPSDSIGQAASRLAASQSLQLVFPASVDPSKVALGATGGSLSIEDRAVVQEPNGALAAVSQVGVGSPVSVGVTTHVGSITAQSSVALANNALVGGNLTTAGTMKPQAGATVTGTVSMGATVTPLPTEVWQVEQGDNPANPKDFEPGTIASLSPGGYGALSVKSRSTLTLTTGAYGFTSFDIEPQATLWIDDSAGPVRIYVQNNITYNGGTVASKSGGQPALLLAQVGTAPIGINATFVGELVAPNAALTLGPGQTPHSGTFLAATIDVRPGTVITHRPYYRLTATTTWGVSSTGGATGGGSGTGTSGPFSAGGFDGSSTLVTAGPTGVMEVTAGGATTTLASTSSPNVFAIDPSGTRFGVVHPDHVDVYNVASPAAPAFTVPSSGGPFLFVPKGNVVYVAQGIFERNRFQITGAQVFSPSGLSASFSTPGLIVMRVTPTALIWATRSELVATTLAGVEMWRKSLRLITFEVSANGATLIGLLNAPGTSSIVHVRLSDGTVNSPAILNGTFWNLAAAPGGRFTAATTQTGLTVFDTGAIARTTDLPVTWANSLDVTDQGYAAVGGQVAPQQGELVLVGPPGSGNSVTMATTEIDAYRPAVQFVPGGQSVLLNGRAGVQAFSIQRTM